MGSAKEKMKLLMEWKTGVKKFGAKYLQRFGVPGHYTYVYPGKTLVKFGRKAKFHYSRFIRRSRRFFKKASIGYDATSIVTRPTSWHSAAVKLRRDSGKDTAFGLNLKNHKIYSYRSRRMGTGSSSKLSSAKKKGILRYR